MKDTVNVWEERVTIPTYGVGKAEKNPMFLEKRVYQGSSGAVYPHPVIEKILDEKEDKTYKAVFLENAYLKIMVLPELGGRIQMAYDKVRQRHFIYYNRVIKPALVGLTGPWISGGIEFNWPQHHRPSTFLPLDYTLRENGDGSKTVWVNELERMSRTRGMAGFTLYPGKAYLEIRGHLYNRTPFPQTFLWWANPAVKVNDAYQSVFPPDVHAVFDHGKRDVSSFPVARGVYYKVDYSPGTDISRYSTIPVPTSYMAIRSSFDFMGGYEHDAEAGILHVANHHISPGKKQWTWGNGDFGRAWDRNLTDEDGPYIELMTGVYTDNQPDFSWLQPNEEKSFRQYFMPYSKVGMVKNASREAMLNLEIKDGWAEMKVYATATYCGALIRLEQKKQVFFEISFDLSPQQVFEHRLPLQDAGSEDLRMEVRTAEGTLLVAYEPVPRAEQDIPASASAAPSPAEVGSTEELYLHGLHLEQYRHATYDPTDYYQEALRRDPGDARNNNALGLWYLRRGKFTLSETYFRKAIARLTFRNPNPYDGEPYFNLGCALKFQGCSAEAYEAFYKATWNAAWQDCAWLELARIDTARGAYEEALDLTGKSLARNAGSPQACHLKAVLLRKTGQAERAFRWLEKCLGKDPFNYGCLFEQYLLLSHENTSSAASPQVLSRMQELMRGEEATYIEYSLDYYHAGLYKEAGDLLLLYRENALDHMPMSSYYLGWYALQQGQAEAASRYFREAALAPPDYCFPNRVEDILVLQAAAADQAGDARARYYLGNLWFDKRQYKDAISCWEESARLDPDFPTVHRNLALACHNKLKDSGRALQALETAFRLDESDARVLMELDQLYKLLNRPVADRLGLLERHVGLCLQRDDLYLERVSLLNQLGEFEKARTLLSVRRFHPWEGGEGKVVGQFLFCHTGLARKALGEGRFQDALDLLEAVAEYPRHLGEGKLHNTPENDIHYLQGLALEGAGRTGEALEKFRMATQGSSEPLQAVFYNDPQPDKIFYQGLAWQKLERRDQAEAVFEKLIRFGEEHMDDRIRIDYFAVSLPDLLVFDQDLEDRNRIHCLYMIGLGRLGKGAYEEARDHFRQVLEKNVHHQGAAVHLGMIPFLQKTYV